MLRKWLLSGAATLGAFVGMAGGFATPARADDYDNHRGGMHRHHDNDRYVVYYRTNEGRHSGWSFFRRNDTGWRVFGEYSNQRDAARAERDLERRGYDARVRQTH